MVDHACELRARAAVTEFWGPARVVFGHGATQQLPHLIGSLGAKRTLVVVDQHVVTDRVLSAALSALEQRGTTVRELHDGREPALEAAVEIHARHETHIQAIVAVGGGSTIDLAKAIALACVADRPLETYEGAGHVDRDPPPIVALPTTAGTGSEVSGSSVLVHMAVGRKLSIRSPKLCPRIAVLDPRYLATVPPGVIRAAGIDALAHAIEAYFSTGGSLLTDRLALGAMSCMSNALPRYYERCEHPRDLEAMAWGSCMAGIAFNSARVGLAHAVAAALGPITGLSHGICVAVALPEAIRLNAVSREANSAEVLGHLGIDEASSNSFQDALLTWLRGIFRRLELPANLLEAGCNLRVERGLIDEIFAGGRLQTNPVEVTREILFDVMRRISGTEVEE